MLRANKVLRAVASTGWGYISTCCPYHHHHEDQREHDRLHPILTRVCGVDSTLHQGHVHTALRGTEGGSEGAGRPSQLRGGQFC